MVTVSLFGQRFIFTFLSCLHLYLNTKKELKRQEKIFLNEFKQFQNIEIEAAKRKKITKRVFSVSLI